MKTEIRKDLPYRKTLILLALFAGAFGALSSFLGEIFLPFASAIYAAVLAFENKGKRIFSFLLPVLFIVFDIIFGSYIPVLAIEASLIGFTVFFMYTKGFTKGECAGAVTVIASLMLILSLALSAMYITGEYSLEAVKGFYLNLYDNMKLSFIESLSSALTNVPEAADRNISLTQYADLLFSSLYNSLLSILVIIGFVIAGITFKIFGLVTSRLSSNPRAVVNWRFYTSNVFAYFYIALFVLTSFISVGTDTLALALINLYNIFMVVYAYIGFNYAHAMLSLRRSPLFAFLVLAAAFIFLNTIAISILSAFGVFFTVMKNKSDGSRKSAGGV